MPEVFIDGEKVVFEGTLPATLGELQALLERALGEAGRVLARLSIDGRDGSEEAATARFETATRIEAVSITIGEARRRMADEAASALVPARQSIDALAGEVLRVPWDDAVGSCIRAAEALSGVLQHASASANTADANDPIARATEELGRALESWMDAVQARDAAAVSLHSDRALLPALAQLDAALAEARSGGADT